MTGAAFRLDGKVALVTGAGRGLGGGIALALAGAGAHVLLNSRSRAELDAVAGDIAAAGGTARPLPFDVTDAAAVRDAFAGIPALDILVNNAGLNRPQPFLEVDEATLDRLIDLNVRALFRTAQAGARLMVQGPEQGRRHRQHVVADGACRLRTEPYRLCDDQARGRGADQGNGGRTGAQGRAGGQHCPDIHLNAADQALFR